MLFSMTNAIMNKREVIVMVKYTVGQIAKAMGVSPQTLRHYESLGLIKASRSDNQYRTYSLDDTRRLFMISIYRSMNFSLPKIKELLDDMDSNRVITSFEERITEVDKEIERLQLIKYELEEYHQGIQKAQDRVKQYWIDNESHKMVSVMKSGSGFSLDNEKENELVEYQKFAPHVRQGFVISKDSFKEDTTFDYQYGVFISKEVAPRILSESDINKYLVSINGPLAKTVIHTSGELLSKDTFRGFFDWIYQQGYEPVSDVYGVCRYHSYYNNMETTYFEFAVSINKI